MRSITIGMAALAIGLSSGVFAGTEVKKGGGVEVAKPAAIISKDSGPTLVRDQRKLPGQILRCWQQGRLVYEAGGFRAGAEKNTTAIAVPRAVEGEPVTLFNLREGMCILSAH